MAPRKTALSESFRFSRKHQIAILNKKFGTKIYNFVNNQLFLPEQWIKLLSLLDTQNKSWNFIMESTPKTDCLYRFHFQHNRLKSRWMINLDLKWREYDLNDLKYMYTDKTIFYQYVMFYLIRVPKSHIIITMFNTGRTIILEGARGWNRLNLDNALTTLNITREEFNSTPLPVHMGFTLDSNLIVDFMNASQKQKYLQSRAIE